MQTYQGKYMSTYQGKYISTYQGKYMGTYQENQHTNWEHELTNHNRWNQLRK